SVIFSPDKEVVLMGTVKEFHFSNPHGSIRIAVPSDGKTVEWRVLTESPNDLEKAGMAPTSLRAGDHVTVRARPAKTGGSSAWLLDVKKADGTTFNVDD